MIPTTGVREAGLALGTGATAATLEERLQRQNRVLVQLSLRDPMACGDVPAALREITTVAAQTLSVARVGVWFFNEDRSRIRCEVLHQTRPAIGLNELSSADFPSYFAALEHERVIDAHEVATDPRTRELMDPYLVPFGITSMLDAPIRVRGKLVGVICHEHVGPARRWEHDEHRFAGSLADLIALVLEAAERQRAEAALREEAEVTAALVRVGQEINSSLDTAVLLDRLCHLTAEVLQCDLSHTFLFDAEREQYRLVAGYGETPSPLDALRLLTIPSGLVGAAHQRLIEEGALRVHAGLNDELVPRGLMAVYGVTAGLVVLLRRGESILGAQTAGYRREGATFSAKHERLARGIAQIASLALENARLVEQLARANQLKAEFLATMSHELRTPLSVMIGYAGLLLEGEFGELSAGQQTALQQINDRGSDLLALINSTLDLGRLEAGRVSLDRQRIDLSDLLKEIYAETQQLCHRRKPQLEIICRVATPLPPLETDARKLKLVLKNLIDNAIKFTDTGSIALLARAYGEGVEVEVADTGIGIAPDILPIIFECFRQGDSSSTRLYSGVGLGLYIARRLLDLLGGSISVTTELGKGSTFTVWLPATPR